MLVWVKGSEEKKMSAKFTENQTMHTDHTISLSQALYPLYSLKVLASALVLYRSSPNKPSGIIFVVIVVIVIVIFLVFCDIRCRSRISVGYFIVVVAMRHIRVRFFVQI